MNAYRDTKGIPTIGVGHTSAAGPPDVKMGMTITAQQCDAILILDLAKCDEHSLAIYGGRLILGGPRLIRRRPAASRIEGIHDQRRTDRPEAAGASEEAAERTAFESGGAGEQETRVEGGGRDPEPDLEPGTANPEPRYMIPPCR